jgi:DNA-directed RNA polymerase subunit K/omega|tara:strand:+ start:1343 stop:1864 length:522 start_codon:yes stop_codon:yes gene_type:complete
MPPKKKSNKKKISKEETTESSAEETEVLETETENQDEELLSSDEEQESDDESDAKECDIDEMIKDDNEFFNQDDSSEIQMDNSIEYLTGESRITNPRLTRYEMVRIIGERTKQLTMGAKPLVKNYHELSYEEIALEELKNNMTPFKLKRPLPNKQVEIWSIEELNKNHLNSYF